MRSALLLLVFNRPDKTEAVFSVIRAARPTRLYVAADGPRKDRPGEAEQCAKVRSIVSAIDWPCDFKTLFRAENLGCKAGVSSGIDWFFENEMEGIILEDDVLPDPSFFSYCDELLDYYRDDDRVAAISGSNFVSDRISTGASYFFSRYCHVWGWATWRRAWIHYDASMSQWDGSKSMARLNQDFASASTQTFWHSVFDDTYAGKIDTWDFQWVFSCWQRNAICAIPAENLTRNLGFGGQATHTTGAMPSHVEGALAREMKFPLIHPATVERNVRADHLIDRTVFSSSFPERIRASLRRLSKALTARWLKG